MDPHSPQENRPSLDETARAELLAALNELLEAERAGARVAMETGREIHSQELAALVAVASLAAPGFASAASPNAAPRYADGKIRLDRVPGEKGYWDKPGATSLVEKGVNVAFDANGKLKNIADASKVAPFQPWALALYKFRQQNNFVDDPMKVCIGSGNPRQMMTPGGVRFIQDNNYQRMYMIFGGGNHVWRTIYMDGREAPNADEVTGTFLGLAVASGKATHWWPYPRASTRASGCPTAACPTPRA